MKSFISFDLNDTGLKQYDDIPKKHYAAKATKYIFTKLIKSEKLKDFAKSKLVMSPMTKKLGNDVYLIKIGYIYNTFLIVGKQKALLIDTGFGIRGLREEVRKITDKPVIVAVTHSHFGVVGGSGEFDEVLIHKADLKQAEFYSNLTFRKLLFNFSPSKYIKGMNTDCLVSDKPNFRAFTSRELKRGINLGGRNVEIVNLPSHTKGSCCFIDSGSDIVISGDVVAPLGITVLPGAVNLAKYSESLEKLFSGFKEINNKKIFCSYFPYPLDFDRMCEFKDLIYESIMYGNDYTRLIKLKSTLDRRQFLLYYPAKANKRKLLTRLKNRM